MDLMQGTTTNTLEGVFYLLCCFAAIVRHVKGLGFLFCVS